jgi:hypothetical protein
LSETRLVSGLDAGSAGLRGAAILGSAMVIPAHYDGWAHFSEGRDDIVRGFDDAGLGAQLRLSDHGTWTPLKP